MEGYAVKVRYCLVNVDRRSPGSELANAMHAAGGLVPCKALRKYRLNQHILIVKEKHLEINASQ